MAENKKSFILYTDWESVFNELSDEEAGIMIKHIFKYVNDKNPILEDRLLNVLFKPIQIQLKRDLKLWEQKQGKKSDSGKLGNLKRWHIDLFELVESKKITLEKALEIAKGRTLSQPDHIRSQTSQRIANVAVNVNDNVNVNDINNNKPNRFYVADANLNLKEYKDFLAEIVKSKESSRDVLFMQNKIDLSMKTNLWTDFIKNAIMESPQIENDNHAWNCFKRFVKENAKKYQQKKQSDFKGFD